MNRPEAILALGLISGLSERSIEWIRSVVLAAIFITVIWQFKSLCDLGASWPYWSRRVRWRKGLLTILLTVAAGVAIVALLALGAADYLVIVVLVGIALAVVISAVMRPR